MREELRVRFGHAASMPWIRQLERDGASDLLAVAGPDVVVRRGRRLMTLGQLHEGLYNLEAGESVDLSLTWCASHRPAPEPVDVPVALDATCAWWRKWAPTCSREGAYYEEVMRSLLVLRALTHESTGGIVAAATTSLPEQACGQRNWDYRYVWLRDAALGLIAFLGHSYTSEAHRWRNWLLRAIAGDPADVQIMYGLCGERYLPERELDSLPGYQGAAPVRVGNAAFTHFQGDVIGDVMVAPAEARTAGIEEDPFSWPLQRALLRYVEDHWDAEDRGIWEIRGPKRVFTHSG